MLRKKGLDTPACAGLGAGVKSRACGTGMTVVSTYENYQCGIYKKCGLAASVKKNKFIISTGRSIKINKMISQNKNKVILSKSKRLYSGLTKYIIIFLFPIIFLNFTTISIAGKAPGRIIPFKVGEKLTYKGTWGTIPAGELTLEVLPKKTINGIKAYHFVMITKTNEAVDLIYKIRDRQDSYVDSGMRHSIFYKKKTESKHPRDVSIRFNWKKRAATYTNFGRKKPPIKILPGTFDPLAFFYALRYKNLKENSELAVPLTDGKRNVNVGIIVGKRDKVEIEGKMYDTLEITPNMEMLDKEVKNSDDSKLKVWVTADEKKIPVKIRTKVGIISFDFDLVVSPPSGNKKN